MDKTDITAVADQYRRDGYSVVVGPGHEDLPESLAGLSPDLLARKEGEEVVVEVVSRAALKSREAFLSYWLGKVNNQPGWRFDLVINDDSPWSDKVSRDAHDLDLADIRERNLKARRTLEQGFLEPACLFAWSLAEAALRVVAGKFQVPLKNKMPAYVMKQLYTEGILSDADLDQLRRFLTIRNSVAHGLKTSDLSERRIVEMMDLTEKLLSVAEDATRPVARA